MEPVLLDHLNKNTKTLAKKTLKFAGVLNQTSRNYILKCLVVGFTCQPLSYLML